MSDDERLDYRKLPPVTEDVAQPERISQTLARHANACPRSAFLYLKHRGGGASHPLDRGSAFHLFAERMTVELLVRGEPSLWMPQAGEDTVLAQREVATLTKVMVDEILDDPANGFVIPHSEAEHVRTMAYHLAIAWDVDMSTVYGVERKFVLDLPSGHTLSGKVDLLTWPEPRKVTVTDYKTSLAVPDQGEFEDSFQPRLYGALVLFGQPVEKHECQDCAGTGRRFAVSDLAVPCATCGGRGYEEVRLGPIGEHIAWVTGRQVHPRARPKWEDDGRVRLVERSATWSRKDLLDFLTDVDRAVRRIDHGVRTREWPARHGKHCSECPSEPECPLPRDLRRFAGAITTVEEASEAMEWAQRMAARVTRTKKEVRSFVEARGEHGEATTLLVGDDVFDFVTSFRRSLKKNGKVSDWEGLEAAAQREDFRIRDWVTESPTNEFKKRPAAPGEIEALRRGEDGHDGDEGSGAAGGLGGDGDERRGAGSAGDAG